MDTHPFEIGQVLHVAFRTQQVLVEGARVPGVIRLPPGVHLVQRRHVHIVVVAQHYLDLYRRHGRLLRYVEEKGQLLVAVGCQHAARQLDMEIFDESLKIGN